MELGPDTPTQPVLLHCTALDSTGKEHIDFRKAWTGTKLDMLMEDFDKLSRESEAKND